MADEVKTEGLEYETLMNAARTHMNAAQAYMDAAKEVAISITIDQMKEKYK